jgi:hypothetical protein
MERGDVIRKVMGTSRLSRTVQVYTCSRIIARRLCLHAQKFLQVIKTVMGVSDPAHLSRKSLGTMLCIGCAAIGGLGAAGLDLGITAHSG